MKAPLRVLGAIALASAVHAFAPLPPPPTGRLAPSSLAAYPSTTFDGPAIAAYYNKRPWEVLARLATTATPLGLWWLRVQCDNLTAPLLQRGDAAAQALRVRRGYELKQVIGCVGGWVHFYLEANVGSVAYFFCHEGSRSSSRPRCSYSPIYSTVTFC